MNKKTAATLTTALLLAGMTVVVAPSATAGSATAHATAWCSYQYTGDPATSSWEAYSSGYGDASLSTTQSGSVFAQVDLETRPTVTDTGSTPWKYRATAEDEWDWHEVTIGYTTTAKAEAKAEAWNAIGPNSVWHQSDAESETCEADTLGGGDGGGGGECLSTVVVPRTMVNAISISGACSVDVLPDRAVFFDAGGNFLNEVSFA